MFWRKKQNNSIFLDHDKFEKRSSFRYNNPEQDVLKAKIGNNEYRIINISATGIALANIDLKEGDSHQTVLTLPGKNLVITVSIKILHIGNSDICHCEFNDLSKKVEDSIHQYVFEMQMMDIRNNK